MVRSIAIAAAAAYLTVFVAEGSNAPEISPQGVSSIPSHEDGVSNTEQQPAQQSPAETTSTEARPSSPVSLLTSLLRLASSVIAATRFRKQAAGDSQVSDGISRTGEPSFGESSSDVADIVEAALKASVILPPARGPGVLGKKEVETRTRYMEKVLQLIEECEESDDKVASTGQTLGHVLRLADDCASYYDRSEFDDSVTLLQLTDYLSAFDKLKDALKRYRGTDESSDDAEKVVEAALKASVILPPARGRGVLGKKEVETRIRYMERVLQLIEECEESDDKVDSTGQTLGHRLRLASDCVSYYDRPEFDDSVTLEQLTDFNSLFDKMKDIIKRHWGTDESSDDVEKVVDAAFRAIVVLPPARGHGVLGPKEVATRIRWMQKVLQYINECEESGHNVDSTGQVLGHRLRLAGYTRGYYGNPQFDDNVDPQQVSKYKHLFGEVLDVLKRHFPTEA
ncbi:hypothetical protein EMWEY_00005600 [Eimeria maxima]|uniref:Secreted protein n=1 Tax=Eimeria maxima TaxID=5804 RepID=U6M3H9_EIMMA|nr:hypothetical protein EMWEY_00005600 [Eimeria maxima]CDJ56999.1 hypothetical protein EMWEY_00005600 [Eimeria maxima]